MTEEIRIRKVEAVINIVATVVAQKGRIGNLELRG
jgi:hypothetical protein